MSNTNIRFFILSTALLFILQSAKAQVPPSSSGYGDPHAIEMGHRGVEVPPPSKNSIGTYSQNKKYGFVLPGNKRQELIYDAIYHMPDGFIVKKNGLFGICNKQTELLTKIEYDSIIAPTYNRGDAYIVMKKGKYGSLSPDTRPILSLNYNKILFSDSRNPVSFVEKKEGALQIISNRHEKAYPQKPDYAELYANMVIAKMNGKFGIIKDNRILVPFEYDSISYTYAQRQPVAGTNKPASPAKLNTAGSAKRLQYLIVQKNNKFGLLDSNGAVIYPTDNDLIHYEGNVHTQSYYLLKKDKLFGAFFPYSRKRMNIEYESLQGRSYDAFIMAGKNNSIAVFNYQGEEIIPPKYSTVSTFNNKYFLVSKDNKYGLTDSAGKVLLPLVYVEISQSYDRDFKDYIIVKQNKKQGVVDYQNNVIIPIAFAFVGNFRNYFMVVTPEPDSKAGLYTPNGRIVLPTEYDNIRKSATKHSALLILKKNDSTYNFMDANNKIVLEHDIRSYGYVHNAENLLNPFSITKHYLLYVKNRNGKFGALDEMKGKLVIPMLYDSILQRFESGNHLYYSVSKNKKYGVINEENKVLIPLEYDAISLNLVKVNFRDETDTSYIITVAKGKKYGAVTLDNKVRIPFEYTYLERISDNGLYKARKDRYYQLINSKNEIINKGPFDDIANYEQIDNTYSDNADYRALSFYNGKMRVVNEKGSFTSEEVPMQMHKGYTTFDELKGALVKALDSKDNNALRDFAGKIAPSEHILYYLKENLLNRRTLNQPNLDYVKEKYYTDLLKFKQQDWQVPRYYNRKSLTAVTDFTLYDDRGAVSNARNEDHAFGDTHFLEKVLRNSFKINGFWISSYFMSGRFER